MPEPTFVPGRELSAAFYADVIEPLVREHRHGAGLLGWGSDVLGYDSPRSTDHDWGPRLQVFVDPADVEPVRRLVAAQLPDSYAGWPTVFGSDHTTPQHRVEVARLETWLQGQLGIDPGTGLATVDWLTTPQQQLLGVVRGAIHADPDGRLGGLRELMRLAFLQERRYWPYPKWFGTAFTELEAAAALSPSLEQAIAAPEFPMRERALVAAYHHLAERQNALGLHAPIDTAVRDFHDRPYRVIDADGFVQGCLSAVTDQWLRRQPMIGSVDQFADSTDVLAVPDRARRFAAAYAD